MTGGVLRLEDRGVPNLNLKTGSMSEQPISDLRRRMLEDVAVRKFGDKSALSVPRCTGSAPWSRWPRS
jgi:hypothetical protein